MADLFKKISAKISRIFDSIPNPVKFFHKRWPEVPLDGEPKLCELCYPNQDPKEFDIPDDIRDMELERNLYEYDVKLSNVPPEKWKMVGRNITNMAYTDPMFGEQPEDDTDEEDPLPPPPEPDDVVKAMKEPLISVNLKGLRVVELEELGDVFTNMGELLEAGRNGKEFPNEPTCPIIEEFNEDCHELMFDPVEKVAEEITVNKKITNSDLIPGLEPQPWREDVEDWFNCVAEHQHPAPGGFDPLQPIIPSTANP